jgi:hypothetical protein
MNWLLCNERISLFIEFWIPRIMSLMHWLQKNDVIVMMLMLMLVLLMVFVCTWETFYINHNDLAVWKKTSERATKLAEVTGGILLLLKVFWNAGQQGKQRKRLLR